MKGASDLRMINYKVLKFAFDLNENFEFTNSLIDVRPSFNRNIQKINENQYVLKLSVNISNTINKGPIPFNAEVVISSVFELENWETGDANTIAIKNATAIMFPYLRTLLATITLNGNVPPYNLPIMDISRLFQD